MLPDSVKDKISEVGNNVSNFVSDTAQEISTGVGNFIGKLTGSNDEKFRKVMQAAANAGDPHPAVVAAQWALESTWGKDESGKFNYFGIKARPGQPGTVRSTTEVLNGRTVRINDKFADYNSLEEGIAARVAFTKQNKRYTKSGYFDARTPYEAAQALLRGGYATNPNYANSLVKIIKDRKIDPMKPVVIKPTGGASSGTPAGVNTRDDWNKSQQALNNSTSAPSKEYRDKMNSFGQARQYVMNNKSLTDVQRKQALLKINNEAHAYMVKNNPDQIQYNYDTSTKQNTGTKVNAKTKPGMVAAWCTRNGSIAHSILGKKKGGNCAATVGLALYNAGYIKTARGNGHAYSYGQKLLNLGWKEVTGQTYQVGDIAVCYPNPRAASSGGRKYGHVSVFNGSVWWADIQCHSPCPYRDRNTAGYVVKVYRDSNYMNGGTAVDDVSSRGGFASTVGSTYNSGMNNAIGQTRTFRGSTVNGKVTKEQIERGKVLAKLGYTKEGVSQASKLYSYTTPEAAANMYNYDTSTTVSDKTDGKSKIKVGNVYVDPNTISTDSNITITRDILKDVSKYGNVFNPGNGEPNDALGRLQASIRKLLGVGNIDATMVKTALASTELKREEMQKETQGTTLLSMALDKAKRAVVATTDKNNLKESTKASVEQSKAIKNDLLSVSNEILKEAKEQTKLLTDILSTIRKEKSKPGKEDNSFTPKERVSFRDSINGSSDLKNPAGVGKPIVSMAK